MRRTVQEWLGVVDRRGQFTAIVGLLLAFVVSILEIVGAGVVAVSIQLATTASSDSIDFPIIGDVEAFLPGDDRTSDLRWMAAIGACFFVIRGVSVIVQQYLTFRATFGLAVRLTDRTAERLLQRDYSWHLSHNSAELSSLSIVVAQTFALRVFAPIQAIGAQGLTVLSLSAVAVAVEPVGALGAVAAIGTVILTSLRFTRRQLVPLGEIELHESAMGQQLTTEAFLAIREVKIHDLDASIRTKIKESRQRWARAMRRSTTIVAVPRTIIETAAFSSLIALLAFRGTNDSSALAGIGILGYAVIRILPTANNLVTHVNTFRSAQASMSRLAAVLGNYEDDTRQAEPQAASARLPVVATGLEFSYPTGDRVLKGVDLRIDQGSSIGLVGSTGCGKSTLLDVLAGLLDPSAGTIQLDGIDLAQCRDAWWRMIGIVPQNITLLDASFGENVALGVDDAAIDRARLDRAVELAQLTGLVSELPEGLETRIGERGLRLSGGQRQRLAIARALYRDPPVILLDEATSALDSETEAAVVGSLKADRPERTLIMVAHRISTLRSCDEILLLDRGQVVSRGTHDDLLDRSPQFRRLAAVDDG